MKWSSYAFAYFTQKRFEKKWVGTTLSIYDEDGAHIEHNNHWFMSGFAFGCGNSVEHDTLFDRNQFAMMGYSWEMALIATIILNI